MSRKPTATRHLTIIAGILTVAAAAGCVVLAQSNVGQIQDIYNFTGGNDGADPINSLLQMPNGQFVGETCGRGTFKNVLPTVFRMGAGGALTTLFTFAASGSQGKDSFAGLLQASDGNFYGSSSEGGSHNIGVAFRLTPSGAYTKLLDFTSTVSNQYTEAFDGQLYSVSSFGGTNNSGAITRTTFDGQLSIIYSFGPNIGGGNVPPYGPLVLGPDGMLYGETTYYYYQDGSSAPGSVFKTDTKGNLQTIYVFNGGQIKLGSVPPVIASDGYLYFVSPTGGASPACPAQAGCGSIYRMATDGSNAEIVYSFTGGADGGAPGSLIQGSDGKFYGASRLSAPGAIFQFDPVTGSLASYPFPPGLLAPYSPLLQSLSGALFGATGTYGSPLAGSAFSLNIGLPPAKPSILGFRPMSGSAGALVTIWGSNFVGVTGVTVNGSPAKFRNTASGFVSFAVPQGASSGSVTVTTPGGTAVSSGAFSVE